MLHNAVEGVVLLRKVGSGDAARRFAISSPVIVRRSIPGCEEFVLPTTACQDLGLYTYMWEIAAQREDSPVF